MLALLQIEAYALIERVAIEFGPGFNVLTGETGSGKSIIVDALGLLLGDRADASVIRTGSAHASVTGAFALPFAHPRDAAAWSASHGFDDLGDEIHLRREIGSGGRSRAFVNHQLATLNLLRDLASHLGEIHSQHESLVSFTPAAQLALLDRFAGLDAERLPLAAAHAAWTGAAAEVADLEAGERRRLQDADLWRFQADEIDAAHPQAGEDIALEREHSVLAHAERIAAAAQAAFDALYDAPDAATVQLKNALRQVNDWARLDDSVAPLATRLEALRAETADVAEHIRDAAAAIEASPKRLAQVEDRLAALDRLRRKYGQTMADVLNHRRELALRLDQIDNAEAHRAAARARLDAAAAEYRRLAAALSRKRRTAATRLAKKVESEVSDLAMTIRFQVEFAATTEPPDSDWGPAGWDHIRFLASTNPGEPLLPVAEIASGGELSRLLLALHVLAPGEHGHRTLVLDEVDSGIGGRAAEAVGRKLQKLGRDYQVLCVTHLPQIAACAGHHLRVEKSTDAGRTRTEVRVLERDGRVEEIARMLAGRVNPTALRHARELLDACAGRDAAAN